LLCERHSASCAPLGAALLSMLPAMAICHYQQLQQEEEGAEFMILHLQPFRVFWGRITILLLQLISNYL